jgi:predicted peptidase
MLNETRGYRSFPEEYMDGALDEALAEYRIDPKRVYLTGLSMGGEATYRFALYRPEAFAAVAPFAAFNAKYMTGAVAEGFKPLTLPLERARGLPFWAFHGTDDPLVPLEAAQATVNAFIQAGVDVRFTILDGADHDSWSQAFMDPAFYRWLLEQRKP